MAVIHNDNHALMILPVPAKIAGQSDILVGGVLVFPPGDKVDTRRSPILGVAGRPPIDLEQMGEGGTRPTYERDGDRLTISFNLGTDRQPSPLLAHILNGSGSVTVRYWLTNGKARDKKFSLDGAPFAVRQTLTDGAEQVGKVLSVSASTAGECPLRTWCSGGWGIADQAQFDGAYVRTERASFFVVKLESTDLSGVAAGVLVTDPEFQSNRDSDLPTVYFDDESALISSIPEAPSEANAKMFRLAGDATGQLLASRILAAERVIRVRLPTKSGAWFEESFPLEGSESALRAALGDALTAPGLPVEAAAAPSPGAPPSGTSSSSEFASAVSSSVAGRVNARIVGSAAGSTAFEWTVTLANTAEDQATVRVTLHYLDAKGELLFRSEPLVAAVAPLRIEQIPGMSRLPDADAARVARVQAIVEPVVPQ